MRTKEAGASACPRLPFAGQRCVLGWLGLQREDARPGLATARRSPAAAPRHREDAARASRGRARGPTTTAAWPRSPLGPCRTPSAASGEGKQPLQKRLLKETQPHDWSCHFR